MTTNHADTLYQRLAGTLGMIDFILTKYRNIIGRDRPKCIRSLQIGKETVETLLEFTKEDKDTLNQIFERARERKESYGDSGGSVA